MLLPTARLAFGPEGLEAAAIVFITAAVLTSSFEIWIAKGENGFAELRHSVAAVLIRMGGGAAFGLLFVELFGVQGLERQVVLLSSRREQRGLCGTLRARPGPGRLEHRNRHSRQFRGAPRDPAADHLISGEPVSAV